MRRRRQEQTTTPPSTTSAAKGNNSSTITPECAPLPPVLPTAFTATTTWTTTSCLTTAPTPARGRAAAARRRARARPKTARTAGARWNGPGSGSERRWSPGRGTVFPTPRLTPAAPVRPPRRRVRATRWRPPPADRTPGTLWRRCHRRKTCPSSRPRQQRPETKCRPGARRCPPRRCTPRTGTPPGRRTGRVGVGVVVVEVGGAVKGAGPGPASARRPPAPSKNWRPS